MARSWICIQAWNERAMKDGRRAPSVKVRQCVTSRLHELYYERFEAEGCVAGTKQH